MESAVRMCQHKVFMAFVVSAICLGMFLCVSGWAQQPQTQEEAQAVKDETEEIIKPAPKDIKEAVAIYVFLGWMWLSILVLIYILRQKIKEVDRIYHLKFFSSDKN
jgi:hypothetical protein